MVLIYAVAQQEHGLDLMVILYHLMSFSRNQRRYPFYVGVSGSKWLGTVGFCVVSILEHSVFNTVVVYHSFSYLIAFSSKLLLPQSL